MTVTDVRKDPDALTMTITAEFQATVARVWQLWADPRQLERWWGPPGWPATFVDHDLSAGGDVRYFMTGPDGEKAHGWWRVLAVDAPTRLAFEDGFGDDAGNRDDDMPVMVMRVAIDAHDGGSRMSIETSFPSLAAMERIIEMGMEEGITLAIGQIDAILAAGVGSP